MPIIGYALQLAQLGRIDEALQEINAAQKHDPLSPIIRAARSEKSACRTTIS
jgi:hypothetical protein